MKRAMNNPCLHKENIISEFHRMPIKTNNYNEMKILFFFLLLTLTGCQSPQKKGSQTPAPETQQTDEAVSSDAVIFELAVEGMTCTGCEQTITNSVKSVDGVQWVKAIHTDGKVTVALNKANPDTASIRQKISDSGYQVVSISKQPDSP